MTNAHVIDYENNNNKIYLTQQAYISGTKESPHYETSGEDENGNTYKIIWQIRECYLPLSNPKHEEDEEGDMCDWDEYEIIKL